MNKFYSKTLVLALVILVPLFVVIDQGRGRPIKSDSISGSTERFLKVNDVIAKPITGFTQKQHPFLATQDLSTIHSGGYNSDVHLASGPVGNNTQVKSRRGSNAPGGMCATTTFTNEGNLIVFCGSFGGFELNLLEPRTMRLLAKYDLPMRPSTFEGVVKFDADVFMKDTSSSYFYLDNKDRAVIADSFAFGASAESARQVGVLC